jgi:PII-like signaling protein
MRLQGEKTLLRVYVRSTDRRGWLSPPAAVDLVQRAREQGMAGATVLEGVLGLSLGGQLLESSIWSLASQVPVIVEFVDSPEAIARFLPTVEDVVLEGLATLERAHVLIYRTSHPQAAPVLMRPGVPGPSPANLPTPRECPAMQLAEDGRLVRIFIGEDDRWQGQPLYRAIVLKARELGLAGATVLKGPMGYGANSLVRTSSLIEVSGDLPIVIEVVDSAEQVEKLLPFLDGAVQEGMITIENVRVLKYRHNPDKKR